MEKKCLGINTDFTYKLVSTTIIGIVRIAIMISSNILSLGNYLYFTIVQWFNKVRLKIEYISNLATGLFKPLNTQYYFWDIF